jgi:DNA-directed RNA polymerase specialized sigma24 family protein
MTRTEERDEDKAELDMLVQRFRDGRHTLAEKIILAMEPSIKAMAFRSFSNAEERADATQTARLVVLHAAQRWNPAAGVPFMHYASRAIRNRFLDIRRVRERRNEVLPGANLFDASMAMEVTPDPIAARSLDDVLEHESNHELRQTWCRHAAILVFDRQPEAVYYQTLGAQGALRHLGRCVLWEDIYSPAVLNDVRLCLTGDGLVFMDGMATGELPAAPGRISETTRNFHDLMAFIVKRFLLTRRDMA